MKIRKIENKVPATNPVKRVAAYARVSDGKDAMLRSLSAQVSYYSEYIQKQKDWIYAGVYSDEAETGTKDSRSGLQALLAECRAGNIDMVITKSISRIARNTVIMLETVRELKQLGIDVYFEKENIHTLSGDGEFMLTILASFSQEESRSASENCDWRIQKQFKQGKLYGMSYIYGYKLKKGELIINEEQAAVVRRIFTMYLDGSGTTAIAKALRNDGVTSYLGGDWIPLHITRILKNEKYAGCVLLQKYYTTDHLTKKKVVNNGERTQYYAEDTHPAIIDMVTFEAVQKRITANREKYSARGGHRNRYAFSGRVVCGVCGKKYRRCLVNGKPWWICNTYFKHGKCSCKSKRVTEDTLYAVTATVLGLPSFDESVFLEEIASIIVMEQNTLRFIFKDGRETETTWEDSPCRVSWTTEMREAARNRENKRREKEQCPQ